MYNATSFSIIIIIIINNVVQISLNFGRAFLRGKMYVAEKNSPFK